eukprot:EG_transcript_12726
MGQPARRTELSELSRGPRKKESSGTEWCMARYASPPKGMLPCHAVHAVRKHRCQRKLANQQIPGLRQGWTVTERYTVACKATVQRGKGDFSCHGKKKPPFGEDMLF